MPRISVREKTLKCSKWCLLARVKGFQGIFLKFPAKKHGRVWEHCYPQLWKGKCVKFPLQWKTALDKDQFVLGGEKGEKQKKILKEKRTSACF